MTTSRTQPEQSLGSNLKTLLIWLSVGTAATVFLVLIGISAQTSAGSSPGIGASPMACAHWHNIMSDVRAGILTDPELRTKLGEVRNSASDYSVKSAATELLSAVTRRDKSAILDAADDLEAACR